MANNLATRIASLEAKNKIRESQLSPEKLADIQTAVLWWKANDCSLDTLPRADMTQSERAAFYIAMKVMAEFEEKY